MTGYADRRALLLAALATGADSRAIASFVANSTRAWAATGSPPIRASRDAAMPEDFGADGSVEGDSAGLRLALASDVAVIKLQPRSYRLDAAGLSSMSLSGKLLRGVRGRTTIELVEPARRDMASMIDQRDFAIRDIVFDARGHLAGGADGTYPGFRPCLLIERCTSFEITGCGFTGFETAGLLANIVSHGLISRNRVELATPSASVNYGICVVGGGRNVDIRDNHVVGCNIALDISDSNIVGNEVLRWGFSAGINVAEDARNSRGLLIAFNRCHDSGETPDRDGFFLDGIECWAPGSIIAGNHCRRSIGNGISFGANDVIVAANSCDDNGSIIDGKPVGWGIRALADAQDASCSLVVANRCADRRELRRQAYGFGENSSRLAELQLWANDFADNAIAPLDLHSPSTRVDGVRSGTFVPVGLGIAFKQATGSFTQNSTSARVVVEITLPATRDVTGFGFDGLPLQATSWGILFAVVSPIRDLRLVVSPGSSRAVADHVTNLDLSGARIVVTGEYGCA